ncbi:MAG: DUF4019 domain-containing protein [Planctomycetota bacterium]
MRAFVAVGLAALICSAAGCGPPRESNPAAEKAGVEAADKWLKLMDDGKYEESWDETGEYLKAVIPKQRWTEGVAPARRVMGKLVSRTVSSTQYATTLPGAPDGEYVLVQYQTVFENKKAAVEAVTVSREKDGAWRVSGYFIR